MTNNTIVNRCWQVLVLVAILPGCRKDEQFPSVVVEGPAPSGSFTYVVNAGNPKEVKFTNGSADAESYYWQFGDGTSATEQSPLHVYASSGKYIVILKTASHAGYTQSDTVQIVASLPATADFDYSAFLLQTSFLNNASGIESVHWDFGDNTSSTEIAPVHEYATAGSYEVTLTVNGLTGNVATQTKTVVVQGHKNLVKGGTFDAASAQYWKSYQNDNPPTFGYTVDAPAGGMGGCLRFPSFENPSNSKNQLIYQPVSVVAGKQYKLSAVIKAPAGGYQCYFQFFVSNDAAYWQDADMGGNQILSLNTWHGWGGGSNYSVAVNGDLAGIVSQNGNYGFGAATGGIYTATETRTVYIGVQAGTWSGKSNGDWLVDNLSFEVL
ncbi:MAG: PKD domain-containing protein [Candidatus Pseudobacter hemicellulosilyticus]|uniref:PKD domain-containing protein n=1 Tax=Candidatus Pseudobacter hemicellulosilyticus TaxID=3121375 RepID=A0AAJ5WZT7_9BACT|nr:MAG: PKD domain-containing protein [Pseudobacter sp.]